MSIWFRNRFHDSQRAQETLVGFAVALGVTGFLMMSGRCGSLPVSRPAGLASEAAQLIT